MWCVEITTCGNYHIGEEVYLEPFKYPLANIDVGITPKCRNISRSSPEKGAALYGIHNRFPLLFKNDFKGNDCKFLLPPAPLLQ